MASDAAAALMKAFIWLCSEEAAYTCPSCGRTVTRPPHPVLAPVIVASRIQEILGGTAPPQENTKENAWDAFFPQDTIFRAICGYVALPFMFLIGPYFAPQATWSRDTFRAP